MSPGSTKTHGAPATENASPYPRENYFDDTGGEDGRTNERETTCDDSERSGQPNRDWGIHHRFKEFDVEEVIAHRILRETATMLCAETLWGEPYNGGRLAELWALVFDDEVIDGRGDKLHITNKEVQLSEPLFPLPKRASETFGTRDYGQYRHRARKNPETGYLSMGETTGVVIQDQPEDQFLDTVRNWLVGRCGDLSRQEQHEILQYAKRLKRGGDLRDKDVMTKVVQKVRQNDFVTGATPGENSG